MPAKMSAAEFTSMVARHMTAQDEAEDRRLARLKRREPLVELECTPQGAALLFRVARLATVISDLPERISLGKMKHIKNELSVVRGGDGLLCFDVKTASLEDCFRIDDTYVVDVTHAVVSALGISEPKPFGYAYRYLKDASVWSESRDIMSEIEEAGRHLPRHVIAASVAGGRKCLRSLFGLRFPSFLAQDVSGVWVSVMDRLGFDAAAPLCADAKEGIAAASPAYLLAGRGDVAFLREMLLRDGLKADFSHDWRYPVLNALAHGKEQAYQWLLGNGADVTAIDWIGRNAAHAAVSGPSPKCCLSLLEDVTSKGVSPLVPDSFDERALDIVKSTYGSQMTHSETEVLHAMYDICVRYGDLK